MAEIEWDLSMVPKSPPKGVGQDTWDRWRRWAREGEGGHWTPEGLIDYFISEDPDGYKKFLVSKGSGAKVPTRADLEKYVPEKAPKKFTQKSWDEYRKVYKGSSNFVRYLTVEARDADPEAYKKFVDSLKNSEKGNAMTTTKSAQIIDGEQIKFNSEASDKTISVPHGSTYASVRKVIDLAEAEQEKVIEFSREFDYRPADGAHATDAVLRRLFGVVVGQSTFSMFGEQKPEILTIKVGPKKTKQVPWGKLSLPTMEGATVTLGGMRTKNGPVFAIQVETPKKYQRKIEAVFDEIQKELETNSIYRGHALVGAWELEFMDLSRFDAKKIVFSDMVTRALESTLFNTIRHPDVLKRVGLPIKRSVLLYGPFGTGKSSIGAITAQVAEANGWTFLQARTGEDKVEDVLRTAMLYQPAVVFVEDLGEQASAINDSSQISSLLETFDGITSKDSEVVMVMTTNHVENIHKGMLRPGRIDLALEIAGLDRNGVERLFKAVIAPARLDKTVDYDEVYKHVEGWEPAWIKAVADRAQLWAIARNDGKATYTITTEDLTDAALSLHSQLDLLQQASEGKAEIVGVEAALQKVVNNALSGVEVVDSDYPSGSPEFVLRTN